MTVLSDFGINARMRHIRAGIRVNSRVDIAVEWAEAGLPQRAEGHTVDISPKGCLAVVPKEFLVGQKFCLINLTNNKACEAVMIWRGHECRKGWELGLELQEPSAEFWGMDF